MAKKYSFKPDRIKTNILSKLYLTQTQRRTILKWSLYGLMLLVLSLLQDVVLCRFRIGGSTTELLPCAIFLICLIEGSESGSIFTLVAASLYLFSGSVPGVYSLIFITILGIGVTILRQAYFQKGFMAALVCVAGAMFVYELLVFAIGLFLGLTVFGRIFGFLLTAGLSLISVPILYPIVLAIASIGGQTWKE